MQKLYHIFSEWFCESIYVFYGIRKQFFYLGKGKTVFLSGDITAFFVCAIIQNFSYSLQKKRENKKEEM